MLLIVTVVSNHAARQRTSRKRLLLSGFSRYEVRSLWGIDHLICSLGFPLDSTYHC